MMNYFYEAIRRFEESGHSINSDIKINSEFLEALYSDMNTPAAISQLYAIAKRINSGEDIMLGIKLIKSGKLLGLFHQVMDNGNGEFSNASEWFGSSNIPKDVLILLEEIKQARNTKNYQLADDKRNQIISMGYAIEYLPKGKIVLKKAN